MMRHILESYKVHVESHLSRYLSRNQNLSKLVFKPFSLAPLEDPLMVNRVSDLQGKAPTATGQFSSKRTY